MNSAAGRCQIRNSKRLLGEINMSIFSEWRHRWFGYWRDLDPNDALRAPYPLIGEFVDPSWKPDDMVQVGRYLSSGIGLIISSQASSSPCELPECQCKRVDAFNRPYTSVPVTDGTWIWRDDLIHYVQCHSVRIPDSFYDHIRQKGYLIPSDLPLRSDEFLRSLDWPFVPLPLRKRCDVDTRESA